MQDFSEQVEIEPAENATSVASTDEEESLGSVQIVTGYYDEWYGEYHANRPTGQAENPDSRAY